MRGWLEPHKRRRFSQANKPERRARRVIYASSIYIYVICMYMMHYIYPGGEMKMHIFVRGVMPDVCDVGGS